MGQGRERRPPSVDIHIVLKAKIPGKKVNRTLILHLVLLWEVTNKPSDVPMVTWLFSGNDETQLQMWRDLKNNITELKTKIRSFRSSHT